MRPVSEVK